MRSAEKRPIRMGGLIVAVTFLLLTFGAIGLHAQGGSGGGKTPSGTGGKDNKGGTKSGSGGNKGKSAQHPPKIPPKVSTASLTISVNEPESELFLTGPKGNAFGDSESVLTEADGSPYAVKGLRSGAYTLIVKKDGFVDVVRKLQINGKSLKIEVQLQPAIAYISISCTNVTDASIEVEGLGRFTASVSRQPVKPGRYKITVTRRGYVSSTQLIDVPTPGRESSIFVNLQKIPIGSMMADAEASFTARDYDRTGIICREVLETDPDNRRANLLLGVSLFEKADSGAVRYLITALRQGETVSLDVHIYYEGRGKQLLEGKLVLDRNYLRIDVPGTPLLNFSIFKPDFKGVQQKVDTHNISYVTYQGKGDSNGNGKKSDRTVTLYSQIAFLKGKDKEVFCQPNGGGVGRCDIDSANLSELIAGWQMQLK